MLKLLVVGLGGFVGAVARFGISGWINEKYGRLMPAGTLAVNALGCLVFGVLMVVVEQRDSLSENARLFLMIGLLGSLTTFSTFGAETVELVVRRGDWRMATFNVTANVVVSITAVVAGRVITKSLLP